MGMPELWSAEDISSAVGISKERLVELCQSGYAPHYYLDNKGPLFKKGEIYNWVKTNLLRAKGGSSMYKITVVQDPPANPMSIPRAIAGVGNLLELRMTEAVVGVYFLCLEDRVVYVGQSIDVYQRIRQHKDKKFDRILFLPIPERELDHFERAFILILKPEHNGHPGQCEDQDIFQMCLNSIQKNWKEEILPWHQKQYDPDLSLS
jgi:hypothetical protein